MARAGVWCAEVDVSYAVQSAVAIQRYSGSRVAPSQIAVEVTFGNREARIATKWAVKVAEEARDYDVMVTMERELSAILGQEREKREFIADMLFDAAPTFAVEVRDAVVLVWETTPDVSLAHVRSIASDVAAQLGGKVVTEIPAGGMGLWAEPYLRPYWSQTGRVYGKDDVEGLKKLVGYREMDAQSRQLAVNAPSLGSDAPPPPAFDLRSAKLLTATKKIRQDRDRHFRGEGMENPRALVKYLAETLGDAARDVVKGQLGEEFLALMPKKATTSVNGDDLTAMVAMCKSKMPPVKSCQQKFYVFEGGKYHGVTDHQMSVAVSRAFDGEEVVYGSDSNPKRGLSSRHISEIVHWYRNNTDSEMCTEEVVLFRNGYLMGGKLHPSDPNLFAIGGPDCNYVPNARCPQWLAFLGQQWSDDPASVMLLQELMGLYLVDDVSFHTLTAFYGPTRSGKGTIIRLLEKLVGKEYTCSFSVGTITSNFGCSNMLGKTLATCADARGPWDVRIRSAARERILGVAGGDTMNVDRKFKEAEDAQLRVRLLMAFNDVGDLTTLLMDGKGATAARIRALQFNQSFFGREDRDLDNKLASELPGIALWALEGLARLRKQGFTMNEATQTLRGHMKMTPVAEFLADSEVEYPIASSVLYEMYRVWCKEQGIDKPVIAKFFCPQVVDAANNIEYTEHQHRCSHPGCNKKSRFFYLKADTVEGALSQQKEGFRCAQHDHRQDVHDGDERRF